MEWLFDKWYNEHEIPHYSRRAEAMAVLESLPTIHRNVLEARFYERLSYRQLAVRFTTSRHPGSGGWVLEKAKRAFQREWELRYGEWND